MRQLVERKPLAEKWISTTRTVRVSGTVANSSSLTPRGWFDGLGPGLEAIVGGEFLAF